MDKKPKILIVDDRPENLVALETALREVNVEVIRANSGNEALEQTLYHDFVLALLDIQMPEMDGYELAEILREEEKTSDLPFIFISAVYTDNLNVFKGYEQGAFSFITKPFQPEILINKVNFFMEKHQQENELIELYKNLEIKNEELLYINKELESFSYSVSHDLRSPLRAINGYAKILMVDYAEKLDPEAKRYIETISKNSQKMWNLIDDLLAFSHIGKKDLEKRLVYTEILIQSIVNDICNQYSIDKSRFKIHDLIPVNADISLLEQVLVNLISNAFKYSKKNPVPCIEIGSSKNEHEITYYIKDNGVGFDMKYYDKLFRVFQRLHGESEFEGTGVGLAIVERIITRHGGKVWAEGKKNEGAVFYFTLPCEE
jgi:signal transduction histidine kinase